MRLGGADVARRTIPLGDDGVFSLNVEDATEYPTVGADQAWYDANAEAEAVQPILDALDEAAGVRRAHIDADLVERQIGPGFICRLYLAELRRGALNLRQSPSEAEMDAM